MIPEEAKLVRQAVEELIEIWHKVYNDNCTPYSTVRRVQRETDELLTRLTEEEPK